MLYAGEAESNHSNSELPDYQPDLIWPHQNDLPAAERSIKDVGVELTAYFLGNELTIKKKLAGIGVFVHELGHALGLPDWYCTNNSYGGDDAFGCWSVMDVGCYINNLWAPIGYTAYERSYMGWLDISTLQQSGHVKLAKPYEDNYSHVFYINNNIEDTEYFILENRQPSLWYPEQATYSDEENTLTFGAGLMLTRYAYGHQVWLADAPNNDQTAKRGFMITADGKKLAHSAQQSNLYGNGVNTISGQKFYSGKAWNATLSNITKNADGTIEFDLQLGGGTGISDVKSLDGIPSDATCYDLQGRPVSQPRHGLNICNGKKVVKKQPAFP